MTNDRIMDILVKNAVDIGKLTENITNITSDVKALVELHKITEKQEVKTDDITERLEKLENDRKTIDVVFVLFKYPKIAIALFATSYIITIKEVRDVLIDIVEPFLNIIGV